MKLVKVLSVLFFSSILTGCGASDANDKSASNGNYKSEIVYNFVTSCSSKPGATVKMCGCILDGIMTQATEDEYLVWSLKLSTTGKVPDELANAFVIARKSCN